ncbi:MAG: acyl-CoA dehydrogenase family protein, partial [Massilia sp.]
MSYHATLSAIINDTIAPAATTTDREARFPRAAIKALGEAGLLGLVSAREVGGMGLGLAEAANVIESIAKACPSTAMVVCMHYCATTVLEQHGGETLRRDIAAGHHLSTLAWSDNGSRSHFWAAVGSARQDGDAVVIDGAKSMVTSAGEANSYVWSTAPMAAEGMSTLWYVDSSSSGLSEVKYFDGLGLR